MKAVIDRGGCIGCGLCAAICPAVFRMAEDGLAEVWADLAQEDTEAAAEAVASCPVSVIVTETN